jgi:hypothetical protein
LNSASAFAELPTLHRSQHQENPNDKRFRSESRELHGKGGSLAYQINPDDDRFGNWILRSTIVFMRITPVPATASEMAAAVGLSGTSIDVSGVFAEVKIERLEVSTNTLQQFIGNSATRSPPALVRPFIPSDV